MGSVAKPAPARFHDACAVTELPPGTARPATVAGVRLALVNHDGVICAVDGDCPHAGGPLGEGQPGSGCVLACPWHEAVFDVTSGAPLRGPARKPVRTYQVRVADGVVQVALPMEPTPAKRMDPTTHDRGGT